MQTDGMTVTEKLIETFFQIFFANTPKYKSLIMTNQLKTLLDFIYLSYVHWCFRRLEVYSVELCDNLVKAGLEIFLKEAVVA
jgi:hypothetical protein